VALSDRLTLRVVGKALPSGGVSLTLTETADDSAPIIDITTPAADGLARRDAEERFRGVVENMADIYYHSDLDGKTTLGRPAIGQLLGYMPDEFDSLDWRVLHVNLDRRAKFLEELNRNDGQVRDFEAAYRHKNGETVWLSTNARYRYGDDGEPVGLEGVVRNITKQKSTEESLRRSDASLRQAQRMAGIGYWHRDSHAGETKWSDEIYEFFDFDREAVPSFEEMVARLHPDDQHILADTMVRTNDGEPHQEIEFRVVSRSGEVRYLKDLIEIDFDSEGVAVNIFGTVQDITETRLAEQVLRESEVRFRSLFDNIPNAVSLKDKEDRFILVNKHFEEMFNCSHESVSGELFLSAMPVSDNWHSVLAADQRIMAGSKERYVETLNLQFDDGVTRTLEIRKFPVLDAEGSITGIGTITTDITENTQTESALRESEELLRMLTDNLPNALTIKDEAGRFVFANPAVKQVFRTSPESFIGATAHPVSPDADWPSILQADTEILAGERELSDEEVRFTLTDGTKRVIQVTKFPLRDAAGLPVKVGTICTDITERFQASRALLESEERFRALVDNLPAGVILKGPDQNVLFINELIEEWYGISLDQVAGKRIGDFTQHSQVNAATHERMLQAQQEVFDSGKAVELEIPLTFDDCSDRHLQVIVFPVENGDNENFNIGNVIFDITEKKRVESAQRESDERFRALVDNLPAGVTLKGPDQNVVFVNGRIEEWLGTPFEQIVGRKFSDISPHAEENDSIHTQFLQAQQAVLDHGQTVETECPMTFADGSTHQIHTIYFPVVSSHGAPNDIGNIIFDITDRKHTEDMLRQAQKMQAVGQLTGGVAHDFNNLLAVVIGNLEMAVEDMEPGTPDFNYIRNAFAAAERGATLTHHLLAFARHQVLQPKETNLESLIFETKELMAISMGENIAVELRAGAHLRRCKVDQAQLQNAILNLSINARDAMPSGGHLTIKAENTSIDTDRAGILEINEGDYVCLSVSDTGTGMPEDVIEHVFEPFFTTKDVGEGSGLGLSMVYGFVRQSGGGVEIETAEGKGTTFKLYFPSIDSEAATVDDDRAKAAGVQIQPEATILLVEDNAEFREITRTILESLNFQVIDFGSAEEALEVISDVTMFDLLLSDIGLPGQMNGHELAGSAASARPGLKIVLMSAHADWALTGGVTDRNVSAFIRKPHRKAELAQTLSRVLDLKT
jgi:PAS domain S-box-containing protein